MKKILLIIVELLINLHCLAQRGYDRGRLRPEDYMDPDYVDYSSTDGNPIFYIVLLVIMIVGIIWFKIALLSSRSKEIREKTVFFTNTKLIAYTSSYEVIQNSSNYYELKEYYKEENGKVSIPKYAKCIILEYVPDNHSYVKVKFDKYSEPLFIPRWHLRTPDRIDT